MQIQSTINPLFNQEAALKTLKIWAKHMLCHWAMSWNSNELQIINSHWQDGGWRHWEVIYPPVPFIAWQFFHLGLFLQACINKCLNWKQEPNQGFHSNVSACSVSKESKRLFPCSEWQGILLTEDYWHWQISHLIWIWSCFQFGWCVHFAIKPAL